MSVDHNLYFVFDFNVRTMCVIIIIMYVIMIINEFIKDKPI